MIQNKAMAKKEEPELSLEEQRARIPEGRLNQLMRAILAGQVTLRELEGFSDEDMMHFAQVGHALFTQGRLEDAETIFLGLEAGDPQQAYHPAALGAIYLAENRLDEALPKLDRALSLDAKHLDAACNRAEVYRRLGKYKEAMRDLESVLKLDTNPESAHVKRAKALLVATIGAMNGVVPATSGAEKSDEDEPDGSPAGKSSLPK
jgi:tetratricopeptide (TPR) repeat protein